MHNNGHCLQLVPLEFYLFYYLFHTLIIYDFLTIYEVLFFQVFCFFGLLYETHHMEQFCYIESYSAQNSDINLSLLISFIL